MKYYIIAQEYNYPGDTSFLPIEIVEETDDCTPEEKAKELCEEEAKYVNKEYGVDITIIKTLTGYAFVSDDIKYRCEIIPRNTDF